MKSDGKFEAMLAAAAMENPRTSPSTGEIAELRTLWDELERQPSCFPEEKSRVSFKELGRLHAIMREPSRRTPRRSKMNWTPVAAIIAAAAIVALAFQSVLSRSQLLAMQSELKRIRAEVTLASLHSGSALERLNGLATLASHQTPNDDLIQAILVRLEQDPSINVRLASVRALAPYLDYEGVAQALESTARSDTSLLVTLEIIDLLEARDPIRGAALWETIRNSERDDLGSYLQSQGQTRESTRL